MLGAAGLVAEENVWPLMLRENQHDIQFVPPLTQNKEGNPDWTALRPFTLAEWYRQESKSELHFLYPLFSYYKKPDNVRWSIFTLINYSRTGHEDGVAVRDFSIFPIYYYRNTGSPHTSYGGVFPFVGHVQNFFGNDAITWRFWPLFMYTENDGAKRYGFPYPILRGQRGPNAGGFAVWPLFGHFWVKDKYDYAYKFWPLMYVRRDKLNEPIPSLKKGFIPFYTYEHSSNVESLTWCWPFFGYTDEWDPRYHETRYLWPLLVQGRGDEKYVNRWAPFYTHSFRDGKDKQWHVWPFAKTLTWDVGDIHMVQGQFLYFFLWSQKQMSLVSPDSPFAERTHLWPFVSYWDNGAGIKQVQLLSPLEPFFQHNTTIRRLYSPLFALYRYNQWAPHASEHRLLFGLFSAKATPEESAVNVGPLVGFSRNKQNNKKSFQLLKGLFGLHKDGKNTQCQVLWMKFGPSKSGAK
ncbi:MAG: hypothetical protein A2Y14_05205 [Verrucomicrobia bacterium GWF2_51_19]|nr:MAG: hypothetical protein A2Y14_05205 [Verrucomicrobia bacterium GWF2_51_19]